MNVGFHFADFTLGAGPAGLVAQIDEVIAWAEASGFEASRRRTSRR